MAKQIIKVNFNWIQQQLDTVIKIKKPRLIVSIVPFINSPLLAAARQNGNTPVLVLPSDSDQEIYSHNWPSKDRELPPYRYAIPYSCWEIGRTIDPAVKRSNIQPIGYGIRAPFQKEYTEEEKAAFRKELQIPAEKEVISLMMGSFGSTVIYSYVKNILEMSSDFHCVVICGKDAEAKGKVESLLKKQGFTGQNGQFHKDGIQLSFSILGFIDNVHEYMAISRCIISKPGSATFNQAIALKLPILLDTGHLPWEGLNIPLAEQYGLGKRVSPERVQESIEEMLKPETHQTYIAAHDVFHASRPEQFQFAKNVQQITAELLQEAENAPKTAANPTAVSHLATAKKILKIAIKILLFPIFAIVYTWNWLVQTVVRVSFFSSFVLAKQRILDERRKQLIAKGAKPVESLVSPQTQQYIDAMYIPSPNGTGRAVIFSLGKPYQNLHPDNYQHLLEDGLDVVLFNPTENSAVTMAEDLKALIDRRKKDFPGQSILLHGYCIGAHVAIAAAADQVPPIPLVIDRGYGDTNELAERFSFFAKLPCLRSTIRTHYNLNSSEKITRCTAPILVISAPDGKDRMLHGKSHNLIRDLYNKAPGEKRYHTLPETATHWSKWDEATRTTVHRFIQNKTS